ncbi:MAG: hypothetical protein RL154_1380, partial [Pseudomonadota bacterium]
EGIYVLDNDGNIAYVNNSAALMLGYDTKEMIGQNAHNLFHHTKPNGECYHESECQQKICIQNIGCYSSDDDVFWSKDNTPLSVSVNVKILVINNQPRGSVVSFSDISHRKILETQLRTSNQIIYKVLNNIDAEINVIDIDSNEIIFSNNKSRQKHGELVGRKYFQDKKSNDINLAQSTLASIDCTKIQLNGSMTWEHKNTTDYSWYAYHANVIKWINDKTVSIQVGFDITKLKDLERNLERKVQEELGKLAIQEQLLVKQSKLASMGEMVGAIAHQWKQPLNAMSLILADVEIAQDYDELTPEYLSKSISESQALIQHMSKTIDDFRDFLRPDKERVLFEVASLIKQVLVILKAQLNNHNIEIAVIEEYPNVCINGYPNEFKQVALNIINNAKDALVEKAVEKPLILITVSKENEKSVLKIQDNAGGIPQSVIDKIFDPFFTTKSDEHGTGIGLSIAKTIIEDGINGSLTATNIADGARFVIVV